MYATWILILTLCAHVNSGCGNAVTAVSGFTSEAACMNAATLWVDRNKRPSQYGYDPNHIDAICVKA